MSTPQPKSYEQLLSEGLNAYMSKIGVNDMYTGSAVTSFFEAVAQQVYLANASNFSILRDFNLDRSSGEALRRIAQEERVNPLPARVTTGRVTIKDSSFVKRSTKVYAGATAPNAGSSVIKVSDASDFPATGSVYIGRGTNNIEGPLAYSSITPVGGFFELNLVSPTTKFHNISESVILAQGGNRFVAAGTAVVAPASGGAEDVNFTITQAVTILDGENEIKNVPVAAQEPGSKGNVPRAGIKRFISPPFIGATVTNEIQFTTGRDEESDAELKARVKRARLSKGLGTSTAVRNSVLGQQAPDEAATIVSAQIFSSADETTLFIDNGEGYEEKTEGVGVEFIVDNALGGETNFQLATGGQQSSIAKAFLESNVNAPFDIRGGDRLALSVGGVVTEHVFANEDFRSPGFATAYEVVASVNANPNISFSGRTADNARKVAFFAKTEEREFIEKANPTQGRSVADLMGLPINEVETLRIYKNGKLLSKNGRTAVLETQNQQAWANNIATGDTLVLAVDKTQAITYTFTDADFIAEGNFVTVNKNNTLESWANVINAKITGITALVAGTKLQITSNLGTNSRASLEIDPASTLVSKGMFTLATGLSSQGAESDFKLSVNTAQFKLLKPLQAGDSLSAGTEATKGNIVGTEIAGGTVNFSDDGFFWVLVDVPEAIIIPNSAAADSILDVLKPSANIVRYQSSISNAFAAVQEGDWVIVRSPQLSASNRLEGRVFAKTNNTFDIRVTPSEWASAVVEGPIIFQDGITFTRTPKAVQKIKIPTGVYSLFQISEIIQNTIIGATSSVINDKSLVITTKTEETDGSVFIVDVDAQSLSLGFVQGQFSQSDSSLFAYYESGNSEDNFPAFFHSKSTSNELADPPTTAINSFNSLLNPDDFDIEENVLVCGAQPFNDSPDSVIDNECTQVSLINANTIELSPSKLLKRIRQNDRFYLSQTYDFSDNDTVVTVLDSDPSNKTFSIPLFRRATVNPTSAISPIAFRAFDSDSGVTTEFSQFFGSDFDFSNFKVMMKARNVIHPNSTLVDEDAVLIRSAKLGLTGEKTRVCYEYPTQPELDITHVISVEDLTKISIFLKSGESVSNTIDGTTEWDVTITPVAGYDEVTYTWNGSGTNPNISALLSSGGYASIGTEGEFSVENTGTFRVMSSTATSFTVSRPTGVASAETDRATLTNQTIRLFLSDDTTAQEIVDYINSQLSDFIEAEIVDDNGTLGSGVIELSTFEDNGFTQKYVALLDGQNYILSSNLSAISPNPQFTFKRPLTLPSFSTATANAYAFNNGEVIRFIPTTAKQVEALINVLAVSGVTTVGSISAISREGKVQIKSEVLGSRGSVQVVGGRASMSTAQVQQAASRSNINFTRVITERSAIAGFHGGQWVKLEASNLQKKNTAFTALNVLDVAPNAPTAGRTLLKLSNRSPESQFFGKPRNFIRDEGVGFKVEKQGSLTAIMWNEVGSFSDLGKVVEINNITSGISVDYNEDTGFTEYTAVSGTRNFAEVGIGDIFNIDGFSIPSNNGTFRVVGVSDDNQTIAVDNFNGEDEAVTTIDDSDIEITAKIEEGDTVIIGEPFSVLNRGVYRVVRTFENTIWIENPSSVEEEVVVSNILPLTVSGTTEFDLSLAEGGLKVEWNGNGTNPSLDLAKLGDILTLGSDFDIDNQGSFCVVGKGSNYVVVANANAVAETSIQITDEFKIHRPSMKFYEYEAVIDNDTFIVGGDILTANSIGNYRIEEVLSQSEIVVEGILTPAANLTLGVKAIEIFVEEQTPYKGYKRVYNKSFDPANTNQGILVFDTANQFLKINRDVGAVRISSVGKMEFPSQIKKGVDSYRYHTGLMRQANKVVYGEPRGGEFEGVAAAGAEIFIRPPLVRRIQLSIVVRLNTGVPFIKIIEQVRDNVSSLVNSTGIGESIPLSSVVGAVNLVSGVFAVSIASPAYNPSSDIIVVNPSEKPLILDPIADIIVSKVGS